MSQKKKRGQERAKRRDRHRPADASDGRLAVAIHEAGHAVAAVVLGLPLRSVDVSRRVLPGGLVSVGFTDCPINAGTGDLDALMPAIVQVLCGPLAELRLDPAAGDSGEHDSDRGAAYRMAAIAVCESVERPDGGRMVTPEAVAAGQPRIAEVVEDALHRADDLVAERWPAIVEVGRLLLERTGLTAYDVRKAIDRHGPVGAA